MRIHSDIVKEIEKLPEGPEIGAFFDFDGTLMSGFSATKFLQEQVLEGHYSPGELIELISALSSFQSGKVGFSAMMSVSTKLMAGRPEESFHSFANKVFEKHIAKLIYPESRALVEAHLRKGHTVAIVSSATPYQVEPAAKILGIDIVASTHMEVKDGHFTGVLVRPTCYGEGKVYYAEKIADEHGVNLDQSFFYSDSHEDIELLERVGNPRPLNPNNTLTNIAHRHGWPIRRFGSRGRPRMSDLVRSIAANATVPAAFAASLPIWALGGSKQDALNFSLSTFGELASAMLGLKFIVRGEQHLWSHRPAVFVFNHQSRVDTVAIAKLLRQDLAGVGKKEILKIPIIGQLFQFGGVVMIDREDTASAKEAMQPLISVMQNEGKSVCIFPEGTRSLTTKLGPFKKGAFHIAMQAGVPMVPIVLHNTQDISPKGDIIMRSGTIEVDVLEPIDTSDWTVETIDQHVKDVRQLFLETLGQTESDTRETSTDKKTKASLKKKATKAKPIRKKKVEAS